MKNARRTLQRGAAGTAVFGLLFCVAAALLLLFSNAPLPGVGPAAPGNDALGQREAVLQGRLTDLMSALVPARDLRVSVTLPAAGLGARGEEAMEPAPAQVLVLLNRQELNGELEALLREVTVAGLGLSQTEQTAVRIVATPFNGGAGWARGLTGEGWRTESLRWSLLLAATVLGAMVLALMAWGGARAATSLRQRPPQSVAESASLEGLRALSRREPRRVANVLNQWIEQDDT